MIWIGCPAEKVHLSWREMLVINCNEFKSTKSSAMSLMEMDFVQLQWDHHRKSRKITLKL